MNIWRLFNLEYYHPAQVEEQDGAYKVCYSYRNPETDEFETFYIRSKSLTFENTPTDQRKLYAKELCTLTNKALGRYYNPFENGDEVKHRTQEENVVQLAQLSILKLFLLAARGWPFSVCRGHWGTPLSLLIIYVCIVLYNLSAMIIGTSYEFSEVNLLIFGIIDILCFEIFLLFIEPKYNAQWTRESKILPRTLKTVWMWSLIALHVIMLSLTIFIVILALRYR